jgi:hypothetical protein
MCQHLVSLGCLAGEANLDYLSGVPTYLLRDLPT